MNHFKIRILFFLAFFEGIIQSFALPPYHQFRLPLNNGNGVPFAIAENDLAMKGFEIDSTENFYFLGGEESYISRFKGEELVYCHKFDERVNGELHFFDNKLYLFDTSYDWNLRKYHKDIVEIDPNNGNIISRKANIVNEYFNASTLTSDGIVLELGNRPELFSYALYSYQGEFIRKTNGFYNLPDILTKDFLLFFIDRWDNNYLFWSYTKDTIQILLLDNQKNILHKEEIDERILGESFYPTPLYHNKVRNGKLYMLRHDKTHAIITVIPLKKLLE